MIVHHFNTLLDGGAGMAARRLHESLGDYGITSRFYSAPFVKQKAGSSYRIFNQQVPEFTLSRRVTERLNGGHSFRKKFQRKLDHYMVNRPSRYELFSYARLPFPTPLLFQDERADVVNLHWVSNMIDYPSFFESIDNDFPIVWTLHDMNPFTGGCHYAWECENYKQECGRCPQLNANRSPNDLSHQNWRIKWQSINGKNIHVVADSHWLEERSKESKLFSGAKSFQTIHYGLDINSYSPRDKAECRNVLGIDQSAFVLSFGASSIEYHRKGLDELIEAIVHLQDLPIHLILFGEGQGKWPENLRNVKIQSFGRIDSPNLLSIVYSASDAFIMPSLQEAFGQTALEAMACGVPVVGYRVGGIPDLVHEGRTGMLASAGAPDTLANAIRTMFAHPAERNQMGINARKMVESEFTLEAQARKYCELYRSIVHQAR